VTVAGTLMTLSESSERATIFLGGVFYGTGFSASLSVSLLC
tara:strand:- start:639 stop:761 length:123 start_codon:yes stop_codon:yes gene_type:complete